jgi:hypothetical protein
MSQRELDPLEEGCTEQEELYFVQQGSKYSAMYDACMQGHRIFVAGIPRELLVNSLHKLTTKYRRQATAYGAHYPSKRVCTLAKDGGYELWFEDATKPIHSFKIVKLGGTP